MVFVYSEWCCALADALAGCVCVCCVCVHAHLYGLGVRDMRCVRRVLSEKDLRPALLGGFFKNDLESLRL